MKKTLFVMSLEVSGICGFLFFPHPGRVFLGWG